MFREVSARRLRTLAAYGGMVVLPVVVGLVVFGAIGAEAGAPGSTVEVAHPFARLLVAITVIVIACKSLGLLLVRIGQPSVVGEIAAGIVLGPSLLSGVFPTAREWLLPESALGHLRVLAQIGLVLFVFLAGLELDLNRVRERVRFAVLVSHASIALSFLLGVLVAIVAHDRFAPANVGVLSFALFVGMALSVTALPVLARILLELDMFHGRIGTLVMTCVVIDEVTAWLLLAMIVSVITASSVLGAIMTMLLTVAFVAALWFLRPVLRRLAGARGPAAGVFPLLLVAVFLAASFTELIGVHAVLGAFLLGLVLRADSAVVERMRTMIGGLTSAMLLPLFFAYAGLGVDVRSFFDDGALVLWALVFLVAAVLGKFGGAALAARITGASWNTAGQVGALMNCRGVTGLVVLEVGRQLGVLSTTLFTVLVMVILATTVMSVPLVRLFRRGAGGGAEVDAGVDGHVPAGAGGGARPSHRPGEGSIGSSDTLV